MTDRELITAYLTAVSAQEWAESLGDDASRQTCAKEAAALFGKLAALGYNPADHDDLRRRLS